MPSPIGALTAWLDNKKRVAQRNLSDMFSSPDDAARMHAARIDEDLTKQFADPNSMLDFVAPGAGAVSGALGVTGKLSGPELGRWLNSAIDFAKNRRLYENGEIERIEKIARDVPLVPRVFSPQAVAEKAVYAPDQMALITPRQFEQTAWPLDMEAARPYIEHYKDLIRQQKFVDPEKGLFTQRYVENMRDKPYEGFSDIPFLKYMAVDKERPGLMQFAVGHEGRHRNRAIAELFGEDTPSLVHLIPNRPGEDIASRQVRELYPEVMGPADLKYKIPIEIPRGRFAAGGLAKAAGYVMPDASRIYDESVAFGQEFPGHNKDGAGDAARHAYASSRIARRYSPTTAKILGGLYEALSMGADRRSTRMDEANNAAGIGLSDLEDNAAKQRIRELINQRQLNWLDRPAESGY